MNSQSFCPSDSSCETCELKLKCSITEDYIQYSQDTADLFTPFETSEIEEVPLPGEKFRIKELRGIAKIGGLALCYGGTAYTLGKSMKKTPDQVQPLIDNFFRTLTTLKIYMDHAKTRVATTKEVRNLFKKRRGLERWVDGTKRDFSYAERTALNHPIQSTGAEMLKIEMLRIDDFIAKDNLNPLHGQAIPRRLDLNEHNYRDIQLGLLSSVHDELVFQIDENEIRRLLPRLYTIMQLQDLMNQFNAGFTLECDCEFDEWRSWTGLKAVPSSLVHLWIGLDADEGGVAQGAGVNEKTPAAKSVAVRMEDLNTDLLREILEVPADEDGLYLVVTVGDKYMASPHRMEEQSIRALLEKEGLESQNVLLRG